MGLDSFDGHNVAAVQLIHETDAGKECLILDLSINQFSTKDCAGPTIAFAADHFGTSQPQFSTQEICQGPEYLATSQLVLPSVNVQ